ncbi:musculin-like isoform X1 [Daphnia carinata]|uniref:musculin-like isoform X1 n=1 Tax=Daphnia carinata TaxID=120202 RepID=UPI0028697C92|nr:musculin-like isoform X1 [Daphnia carinata]
MPRRRKDMISGSVTVSSVSRGYSQLHHRSIVTKEKPQQRNGNSSSANARERARMRVLSRAFCRLKTTLPWVPADTKLSKLDTLRLATTYIGHLRAVLVEGSTAGRTSPVTSHPVVSMSWPFMFNKSGNGQTNSSSDSGSDSPTSSVDHFNLHECMAEDDHHLQNQLQQSSHHQNNIRDEIPVVESSYQIHQQQHRIDYSNIPASLNYCGHLAELQ